MRNNSIRQIILIEILAARVDSYTLAIYERVASPLMKLVFTYCATKHKIVDLEKQVLHVAHHFHKPRYAKGTLPNYF